MPEKTRKSAQGGWWFLTLVIAGYGLLGLANPQASTQALTFFVHVMEQMLPVLGLVFFLLFIANLILSPERIRHYLGRGSGLRGWAAAVVGGILSIGPIYAWYTMLGELQQKGMRRALIATFLYSRAVKLPLLPLMIYYFGMAYTLVLCFYLICFSIIIGVITEKIVPQRIE